ncbi:MAG: tetratricopeptide repeat protein, partial [Gammaproteobacteria bacterium]
MKPFKLVTSVLILLFAFQQTSSAETYRDQIQLLIDKGQLQQALELADEQIVQDDSDIRLLFMKGLILTRMDDLDNAAELFVRMTNEHPELPEPFNNLAVIYALKGEFDKAEEALQKAINTHPSYATAHENLGDLYAKMASQAYNQALELDQDNKSAREK